MPSNVFPDLTRSKFDIQYARRRVLTSDVIQRASGLNGNIGRVQEVETDQLQYRFGKGGEDEIATEDRMFHLNGYDFHLIDLPNIETEYVIFYDPTTGMLSFAAKPVGGTGGETIPEDEEYTAVAPGGITTDNFVDSETEVFLTSFEGFGLRVFRNNILQSPLTDYTWDSVTFKLTLTIPIVQDENFKVQAKSLGLPSDIEKTVVSSGGNINNILDGNNQIFLPTFTDRNIRVFRNRIIQSKLTEFTWNKATAELLLTINPVLDETFIFQAY